MKLRMRFWGTIGSVVVISLGAWSDESALLTRPAAAAETKTTENQIVAQAVASAIARAVPERGYSVSVECQNGVVTIRGNVSSHEQMMRVLAAAQATPSVARVVHELAVGDGSSVQPVMYIRQANAPQPQPAGAMAGEAAPQQLAPARPQHVFKGTGATQYDYPYMPPFSWPAYAPYPNYSALQYPTCYPNSAWPHIGPYTPYPEPPLDWREVKLKWNDGHWYLRFKGPCESLSCFQCPIDFGKSDCGWEVRFKKPWHTQRYPN